jgi:hypothetical protein
MAPRPVLPPRPCRHHGRLALARHLRGGRCLTWYRYWYRTGRERPKQGDTPAEPH